MSLQLYSQRGMVDGATGQPQGVRNGGLVLGWLGAAMLLVVLING